MTCTSKFYQSIVNSCVPKKGIGSTAYWAYLSDLTFGFTDNTITSIIAPPMGVIETNKFALNVGHDLVVIEDQPDRFIQKFTAVINENSEVVDKMDDIVVFVKETGVATWSVYGAKLGLWKTSQAQMINDNRATIAVEFASREGMEEEYEKYNTSIDISALPNMNDYDLIYGGTIADGGAVKLTIDAYKVGYVRLPNGTLLTTEADVIDTTYSGVGGAITYYAPKNSTGGVYLFNSALHGALVWTGIDIISIDIDTVTSLTANNSDVFTNGSVTLTNLIAPKAVQATCPFCALTDKSIGDILYAAYADNRLAINFNFSEGTNALQGAVNTYLQATYGVTYATVYALLVTTNLGTILIDTV
jgi:hypothetical protein